MGFNRRIITNDIVKYCFYEGGALLVLRMYESDSIRFEEGISSSIYHLIVEHKGDEESLIYKIEKHFRDYDQKI